LTSNVLPTCQWFFWLSNLRFWIVGKVFSKLHYSKTLLSLLQMHLINNYAILDKRIAKSCFLDHNILGMTYFVTGRTKIGSVEDMGSTPLHKRKACQSSPGTRTLENLKFGIQKGRKLNIWRVFDSTWHFTYFFSWILSIYYPYLVGLSY